MTHITSTLHRVTLERSAKLIIAAGLLLIAVTLLIGVNYRANADSLTFNSVADTQISAQTPTSQYGGDVKMTACGTGTPVCSVDNADEKRGLVKFDVSGLVTGTTVVSAKLRFHVDNKPVPAFLIKQTTTTDWQENVTWNNAVNLPTTSASYSSPAASLAGWVEADVTGAVTGNGTYSFVFYNSTSTASRIATKESVNVPKLLLTTSVEEPPVDPEPPVTGPLNTYLGTTHVHTGAENDHGSDSSTAGDVFAAAKSSGLHFTMITEHSGPTGPTDALGFYSDAQAKATTYSADGTFVGLAGYEYSENGGDGDTDSGHMTGWGTQEFVNAAAPGMDFNAFYNVLIANHNVPRQVLAGFNHPVATGHPASVSSHLTPERRELVVMSETSNAVAYNATEEAKFYQGFVAELDRGWRVAPTCGLDSHGLMGLTAQESATKKPCRTGALAPSLTKDTLVDAFMQRRIYSTRDMNMQVAYKANGFWMGSKVGTPTSAALDVTVIDPDTTNAQDKITKIEVIGNGGVVLASQTFNTHTVSWQPTVAVGTNDYMFIRVFNGERTAHTAVAAPVWFE